MSLRSWARSTLHTLHSTLETARAGDRRGRRAAAGAARRGIPHRRAHLSEALEQRILLTTLRGGDTFEYADGSGEIVRIRLTGNIAAEFVGASVSGLTNEAEAANLPGNLNGTDILGGIGGPGGIDIIGTVGGLTLDPDINALAANSSGVMYAFELQEIPIPNPPQGGPQTRHLVNLVRLDFPPVQPPDIAQPLPPPYGPRREVAVTSTRLFELSDEIIAESGGVFAAVNTVPAADFNPANGLLYFVATGGPAGQNQQNTNFDKLFTVNVNTGTVNGINGFFNDTGGQNGVSVASIAFDQTPAGAQLVALVGGDQGGSGGGGGGGGGGGPGGGGGSNVVSASNPFIAVVDQTNTDNFLSQTQLVLLTPGQQGGAQQVPNLSGIEILNEDPTRQDDLLAVGPGSSFQIVRTPGSGQPVGTTLKLGDLAEPIPPGLQPPQDPTGGTPSALMFVPGMIDPFTNTLGAYVSFDTAQTSNKLFWVNRFEQRPVTIYQVYVASSDVTGSISVSRVPGLDQNPRPMTPFEGNFPGGVRHINAQNPGQFPWPVSQAGSIIGQVFIGARTRDLNQNDPNDDLRPILTATIPPTVNLGLLPVGTLPTDPTTGRHIVGAGVTVNGDMDRLLIGGAITGDVVVNGSMNQMYCGWLLTGDAQGEAQGAGPTRPQNFRVFGDLRDLYVRDSLGTDNAQGNAEAPTYVTGFDLRVGGKVGYIRSGDTWVGNFDVANRPEDDPTRGIDIPDSEIETKTNNQTDPGSFDTFQFGGDTVFFNDTFDTPQYLGAIDTLGQTNMARVTGTVQHLRPNNVNDWVDYYAVTLMAGQSVQVQLLSALPGLAYVGVFDPDQRLIGTDASDVGSGFGQVFQVTADRPGTYRFAVSLTLNFGFYNQAVDPSNIAVPYELRVTGVGDLGVGGIQTTNAMVDVSSPSSLAASYLLESGDMGELRAGTQMVSIDFGLVSTATVRVLNGNLRSLDGGSIGRGTASVPPNPADPTDTGTGATLNAPVGIDVPGGSVGLIRARAGIMYFNASGTTSGRPPIGGDYQLVDATSSCYVELIANRGIGVLRAADMQTTLASTITANFDNTGNDGIIDLIDVTGNFGSLVGGGPGITTNSGGNVRYIRVGGTAFTDLAFGGGFGTPIQTTHLAGETVSLTDDGGATMNLVPMPQRVDANGVPIATAPADFLQVRAYGIRGSGGVAVIDVRANDTFTIDANGSGNPNATAEIGRIIINGGTVGSGVGLNLDVGGPVVPSASSIQLAGFGSDNPGFGGDIPAPTGGGDRINPFRVIGDAATVGGVSINDPGGPQGDLDVVVGGVNRVDIWDIVAIDNANSPTDSHLTSIRNNTPNGEIVNVRAASVGEIVANGSIGLARSTVVPGMVLNPLAYYNDLGGSGDGSPFPGTLNTAQNVGPGYNLYYANNAGQFPYIDQRVGVWISGDLDENPGTAPVLPTPTTPGVPGVPAISGDVVSIRAGGGIGNIVVNGSIGELLAGKGAVTDVNSGGIQGIVWARGHSDAGWYAGNGLSARPTYGDPFQDRGGDIWFIDVGSGLAASGSGSAIRAGIYAARHIDHVLAENADIRGNIVAGDEFEAPRNRIPATNPFQNALGGGGVVRPKFVPNALDFEDSIRLIEVRNGSIINANIGVVGEEFTTVEQALRISPPENPEQISNPEFEIGKITVTGNGGIIGTSFQGADIGLIDVNDGFGIFTCNIVLGGTGVLGGIEADNYGIRGVVANAGGSMQFLNARGDGSSVSTAAFSPSVRRSELGYTGTNADPITGFPQNVLTDIHAVLGTTASTPELPGRTDTGVIEDVDVRGQRDLGSVRAQEIRALSPDLAPSRINFANSIGNVVVRHQINGLTMTTGRLNNFKPAGDVFNLDLTVAGTLKNLLINGDLAEGSVIRTQGRVGNMGDIKILGSLDGDILASGKIKRLFVGQSVAGNISSRAGKGNAVGQLIIGGDIAEGGLNIQGNMGRILISGNLGHTGSDFTVTGKLGSLTVRGDLYSNLHVGTTLGKLTVGGSIISGVLIEAQQIKSVNVGQDVQPGVIFRSHKPPKIKTGGQMLGQIELT